MDYLMLLLGIAIGIALGSVGVIAFRRGGNEGLARAEEASRQLESRIDDLRLEVDAAREAETQAREQLAALEPELKAATERFQEQKIFLEQAQKQMAETFAARGQEALKANSDQFLKLAEQTYAPMKKLLEEQNKAVADLESKRVKAYTQLDSSIKHLIEGHEKLDATAGQLASALRRPDQRGRWGEMQLRNVVELAGMVKHCDFHEQSSTSSEEGAHRPDMLVRMPGDGKIIVDAKSPLQHYLDALDQPAGSAERDALMLKHAETVQGHARALWKKEYWKSFDPTPELVVMFVPLESAFVAALEVKPDLHARALENKVLIATPTLLLGLLRSVAWGWRQESVAENAQRIADLGRVLHDRIGVLLNYWSDVGRKLDSAVTAYNKAVGSVQSRLIPAARDLQSLGAAAPKELAEPGQITRDIASLPAAVDAGTDAE